MLHSRLATAAVLLAVMLTACGDSTIVGPDGDANRAVDLGALLAGEAGTLEANTAAAPTLFDRLAAQISGFGGLYRDGVCVIAVVLTDLTTAERAIRTVRATIEPLVAQSCATGVRVHAVQGLFTYTQLKRVLTAARPLGQIRGVTGATLDFKLNRLVILVAAREVVANVLAALPRLGIPQEAVTFRLAPSTASGTSP